MQQNILRKPTEPFAQNAERMDKAQHMTGEEVESVFTFLKGPSQVAPRVVCVCAWWLYTTDS